MSENGIPIHKVSTISSALTAKYQNTIIKTMFRVNTSKSAGAKSATNHTTNKLEQTAENTFSRALDTSRETVTSRQYNKKDKILVICGPTATGKTRFGLDLAKKLNGEIVSADSRQVYTGRNIVTGKDLPKNIQCSVSNIQWRDRYLKYYEIGGIKIWLYDIVEQGEEFSVALWRECAQLVIEDIRQRGGLPIVVGGTGLYIKSLTQNLADISVSRNLKLRQELQGKNVNYLFNYLKQRDPVRAQNLNESDRRNPRRLVRAIEIASQNAKPQKDTPFNPERSILDILKI